MDTRNGDTYPSKQAAVGAGVPELAIVEVTGPRRAIGRLRMACRNEAKRRAARAAQQKASRKRNRGVR